MGSGGAQACCNGTNLKLNVALRDCEVTKWSQVYSRLVDCVLLACRRVPPRHCVGTAHLCFQTAWIGEKEIDRYQSDHVWAVPFLDSSSTENAETGALVATRENPAPPKMARSCTRTALYRAQVNRVWVCRDCRPVMADDSVRARWSITE